MLSHLIIFALVAFAFSIKSNVKNSAHQCSTSVFQFVYTLKLYRKTIVRFLYNMYHIVVYEIKGHLIKLSLLNIKYTA